MNLKLLLVMLYVFFNIETSQSKSYDLIIIPVPKSSKLPFRSNNLLEVNLPKRVHYLKASHRNDNPIKLDMEQYDVPTEMPDIDNFDYDTDRYNDRGELDRVANYDNYGDDKIVGGFEVDINLYPYHVAYGSNCGGAIIDKKWIITAGHCGKKPYIRVGSKYLNQGRKLEIKSYHVHPMWTASKKEHPFDYDFQLLELQEPLKFDENIQPVKIAHIEDMVIGKVITVTGWGNTEENGPYSSVLRAVRVPVISKENCQNVPFPYFRGALTPRMFCAGFSEGKKDACQGDSGGPAVAYDRILGMVSFGYGCATPGSYGVYSKIAKVRSWVEQITGQKFDCIIGGNEIDITEAPYQVNYGDICGGVLIHSKWVLTSAHCGTQENFIRVGSKHRLKNPQIRIASHLLHPNFGQSHAFDFDVQLLRLYRSLRLSIRVQVAAISEGSFDQHVWVSGWGYSKEKTDYNDILQQVELQIIPVRQCQRVNNSWYNHTLTKRMFCAGGFRKDACQGDSGGGAVSLGRVIGISSFGFGCGRNIPGVYTNVSDHNIRQWIKKYTGV